MRYLIGIGNYTASDDSVGPRLIELVAERGLDTDFRAIDLGANSLNLLSYLTPETEAILIVDSARMGVAPGDYRFFALDQVTTQKPQAGFSTHEGDLLKIIDLARAVGHAIPSLLIMGIEPESLESGMQLSAALTDRLADYAAAAIARLRGM